MQATFNLLVERKRVIIKKLIFIASISLLLLSGRSVFAEDDRCRSGCETEESDCNSRASNLPNDVEIQDALKACEDARPFCYDRCEKEKALKEQQEKELQEQKNNEKSMFISPQNL